MNLKELKPRKALNKAFLKVKPNRIEIENFKTNLIQLLDRANDTESEEFHKNLVSDFLKDTYYKQNHFINTKGRNDLVIHNGNSAKNSVGVIVEAKKPTNKSEMISPKKLNAKAFQELVLYYLRERITHKNLEVKHLVITNIYEWFIFDATLFDRLFAQNKNLVKQFNEFEGQRLSEIKTDFFYKQIAEPFIAEINSEIEFTYFNLQDYQKPLRNADKADDNKLIALFKLLSPEHLLKQPFINDSNSLDKRFYSELLHIIGLTETKLGSKKLIDRNKEGERNTGSILEDAMIQLDSLDKINRLNQPNQFGNTHQEKLFNVALELSITWINRILFLKLLEAQLITYHKGDKSYSFLSLDKIKDYDDLNSLFFQVLAKKYDERNEDVKKLFEKVPYLNSSLFEPTEIEQVTLFISNLRDDRPIPVISSTVLKNDQGKKRTGELTTLEYLFEFLNAYDFSSEGSEEIQEDNKTLINASVLGLIFEKINGYKDGSFFTPGFITMYMCRETIRKAVVQKFNESKNWDCENLSEVYDKIHNRDEANEIVNSLKICDPAVGSGHFLVSALNELIAIKNDLKILQDRAGKRLKEYQVEVVNDELIVTDEEGELFEYNPNNKESQRIQETLFHEKQTLIENCLFGVDINPNSVKICRLRLWIELLKNAYYKNATELETLPNIDINIKCGNSLVSRFAIDADLSQALKKSKWNIDSYRIAVDTYRNAENKAQKREMEKLIADIKSDFRSEITLNDTKAKKLRKLSGDLFMLTNQTQLFEMGKKEKADWSKKVTSLTQETAALNAEIDEIKSNKIFENAFEWRFEFPEVLNDDGDFMGFDVVIGNPPYVQLQTIKEISRQLERFEYLTFTSMGDLYALFYERGNQILKNKGVLCFISGSAWMRTNYGQNLRTYFNNHTSLIDVIDLSDCDIFDSATVLTTIITFEKSAQKGPIKAIRFTKKDQNKLLNLKEVFDKEHTLIDSFPENSWVISDQATYRIKSKVEQQGKKLIDWNIKINRGILTGYNEAFIIDGKTKNELIAKDPKSGEIIKPLLRGRDVKRYYYEFEDLWLIGTFPSLNLNIDNYPAVKDYLQTFGKRIEQSGEKNCRKKTSGKWFETQDSIAYWEDFEKPKIIYPNMTKFLPFSLDLEGKYLNDKCFILTGEYIYYLTAFLNSKLFKHCFSDSFPELQGNSKEIKKFIVEQIPVKQISNEAPFIEKVNAILSAKKQNPQADTTDLEAQIDQLVYALYGLTEEEIAIVESSS
ncbi:MAG: type II restriction endonuclease [Flavobacteria bacterium RIFCSPLOWO2_12_FULL_35_11]|nr:MAG: type II restriction endonuclease [Flavobacteria bacterium RIFCSPLOWO2_12_FULL_35_11]